MIDQQRIDWIREELGYMDGRTTFYNMTASAPRLVD